MTYVTNIWENSCKEFNNNNIWEISSKQQGRIKNNLLPVATLLLHSSATYGDGAKTRLLGGKKAQIQHDVTLWSKHLGTWRECRVLTGIVIPTFFRCKAGPKEKSAGMEWDGWACGSATMWLWGT